MRTLILLILAVPIHAKIVSVPCSVPAEELDLVAVEAQLRARGHDIKHTVCQSGKCEVVFNGNTTAKPADLAPVFTAAKTLRQKQFEDAAYEQTMIGKLEAGTATPTEKDRLLVHLLRKLNRTK